MHKILERFERYQLYESLELLAEAIEDIGLPPEVAAEVRLAFPDVEEKALTWFGNLLLKSTLIHQAPVDYMNPLGMLKQIENLVNLMPSPRYQGITVEDADTILTDLAIQGLEAYSLIYKGFTEGEGSYKASKKFKKYLKSIFSKVIPKYGFEPLKHKELARRIERFFHLFDRYYGSGPLIGIIQSHETSVVSSLLQQDKTYLGLLSAATNRRQAYRIARQALENREDPEQVVHTFDDGTYWYDLDTTMCSEEGDRMGHCGSDSRGGLFSLRWKKPGRRESSSYVTISYNSDTDTIYQIKGRNNDAPRDNVWDHIVWFIKAHNVQTVEEEGEHSNNPAAFADMIEHISQELPNVDISSFDKKVQELEAECTAIQTRFDNRNPYPELIHLNYDIDDGFLAGAFEAAPLVTKNAQVGFNIELSEEGADLFSTGNPEDVLWTLGSHIDALTDSGAMTHDVLLRGYGRNIEVWYTLEHDYSDHDLASFDDFADTITRIAGDYEEIKDELIGLLIQEGFVEIAGPYGDLIAKLPALEEKFKHLFIEYSEAKPMAGVTFQLKENYDDYFKVFDSNEYIRPLQDGDTERSARLADALAGISKTPTDGSVPIRGEHSPLRKAIQKEIDNANEAADKQKLLPMFSHEALPIVRFSFSLSELSLDFAPGVAAPRHGKADVILKFAFKIDNTSDEAGIAATLAFIEYLHGRIPKILTIANTLVKETLERLHQEDRIHFQATGQGSAAGPGAKRSESKLRKIATDPRFVRRLAEELIRRKNELL
jgi:hypothetical protein